MTDESPLSTARLLMMMPASISMKPAQAIFGVASRHFSKVDEQKYNTAISNVMIQKISALTPCRVSNW